MINSYNLLLDSVNKYSIEISGNSLNKVYEEFIINIVVALPVASLLLLLGGLLLKMIYKRKIDTADTEGLMDSWEMRFFSNLLTYVGLAGLVLGILLVILAVL